MREVGAFAAKNSLSALLDLVEHGEEIVITRHGKPVARLVPPIAAFSRETGRAAMRRIAELSAQQHLPPFDWAEWESWRDAGRP